MPSRPRPAAHAARRALGVASSTLLAAASVLAFAAPVAGAAERTEQPIESRSPQTDVVSSVVSLHVPLPAGSAPHPAACDWIQYQRFRGAGAPSDPMQSDAVAVLMPGIMEGATAFDPVARNAIRAAAAQGTSLEVWALDRRSNCLEDHTGIDAATAQRDPQLMLDYYYGGKAIDGQRFAGFAKREPILRSFGLARTMADYRAVLVNELPDQAWREQHVICGGHSLGGPLTRRFASWDFDGNPATTADAGYRQCAGFFGFDTVLGGLLGGAQEPAKADPFTTAALKATNQLIGSGLRGGALPLYIDVSGIGPETESLLEGIAGVADFFPNDDWTPLVSQIPRSPSTDQFFHLTASANWGDYLFTKNSMRDYRFTNLAALGQVMDDNAAVFGLVRASFGIFDGTPLIRNRLPREFGKIPLLGQFAYGGSLVLPKRSSTRPLIGWRNYDEVGDPTGQPWKGITSPAEEVTDARDFARIVHEGPLDLTEHYFPMRLLFDSYLADGGDRSGDLRAIQHPKGILAKPRFTVIAGNGILAKETKRPDPFVLVPGYEHLDVITAAARQNDGQPERSSQTFASFVTQTVNGQ
jgi:hypothetical protein